MATRKSSNLHSTWEYQYTGWTPYASWLRLGIIIYHLTVKNPSVKIDENCVFCWFLLPIMPTLMCIYYIDLQIDISDSYVYIYIHTQIQRQIQIYTAYNINRLGADRDSPIHGVFIAGAFWTESWTFIQKQLWVLQESQWVGNNPNKGGKHRQARRVHDHQAGKFCANLRELRTWVFFFATFEKSAWKDDFLRWLSGVSLRMLHDEAGLQIM